VELKIIVGVCIGRVLIAEAPRREFLAFLAVEWRFSDGSFP
jgi:hypothetical protein